MGQIKTIEAVDQYILKLPEDIQNITASLRKIILEASPKLVEEYKWSMPNYTYKGLVCYLQASKKHVNLGFHRGVELKELDTNQLLQGTGKGMRHFRIKKMDEIQHDVFIEFIKAAIELNEK
ncbi:DUF1801 domain-containing protein [Bacillus timonensis]|uniref:DUF1801 domain-containing protein n=1 Tax=Bacillus timonensis TaxID=1033734 RepID=UPI000289BCF0|nr:DUF1801 domain-containing protein [Bacillus timonensis]